MIHIVTSVSRPEHLVRIHKSILRAIQRSTLEVRWILVVDEPGVVPSSMEALFENGLFEVEKLVYSGGPSPYGIAQKNFAIDTIKDGFYYCLDDDNVVHPRLFEALEKMMDLWPSKLAFVFGQRRWDQLKTLVADPDRMEYGQIDNSMFVVHKFLIGAARYELAQAGREDFAFFRSLWNVHREEFIFIKDTLAYYNYIRVWPVESPHESVTEVRDVPPVKRKPFIRRKKHEELAPPAAPQPQIVPYVWPQNGTRVTKIALYSSKRERCGISTYTSQLESAFSVLGHDVRHWGSRKPYEPTWNEIAAWKPDVVHFQHEPSIMPPEEELVRQADLLRAGGAKVVITLHTETPETIRIGQRTGRVILHRPTEAAKDAAIIPMPCMNVSVFPDRLELRRKFGFPEEAFILSTVGFMIPWKNHPGIAECLLPWLMGRPDIHLQVIASEHFNEDLKGYAALCRSQMADLSVRLQGRVHHVDGYPSDLELIERLGASDLGYVWCPFDTGSSSAAAAQFTSARCPLVATDSTHYAYLGTGIVRVSKGNLKAFIDEIQKTAENRGLLEDLRARQAEMYRTRNYVETARRHMDIYEGRV